MATESIRNECNSFLNILKNTKYNPRENITNNTTSLENNSNSRVAIIFWQQSISDEMEHIITSSHYSGRAAKSLLRNMPKFEKNMLSKVSHLRINIHCQEKLKQTIHHIGKEIATYIYVLYTEQIGLKSVHFLKTILNNLCWTHQGTINKLKTAEKIIDCANVNTEDKYTIACNYCLVDKIRVLYQQLPTISIKYYINNYLNSPNYRGYVSYYLVLYWTCKITNQIQIFSQLTGEHGNSKFLLEHAILFRNESAVQYTMENYADERARQDLIDSATFSLTEPFPDATTTFYKPTYSNILMYLLTQMKEDQITELCIRKSYNILKVFMHNPQWHYLLVPAATFMKELISTMCVNNVFQTLTILWYGKFITFDEFENMWKERASHFEPIIEENIYNIFTEFFLDPLLIMNDNVAPIMLLIDITSVQMRRYIINSAGAKFAFSLLLYHGRLDVLDQILKKMINERDLKFHKSIMIEELYPHIFPELINENNYNLLHKILYRFCSEGKMMTFKKRLPYMHDRLLILMILDLNDDHCLRILDNSLRWCFNGDEIEITNFKKIVFDLEKRSNRCVINCYFERIKRLIKLTKWDLVEKYLAWIFFAVDKKKINSRKKGLERYRKLLYMAYGKKRATIF